MNNSWNKHAIADYDGDVMVGNFNLLKCRIKKGPNKGVTRYVRFVSNRYLFGSHPLAVLTETPKTIEDYVVSIAFPRGNGPLSSQIDWSKPIMHEFMPLDERQQMVVPHLQPKEV